MCLQVGAYAAAVESNQRAIVADLVFLELRGPANFYFGYIVHNYHFLLWAAMYDGRYGVAIQAAHDIEGLMVGEGAPGASMLTGFPDFLEAYLADKVRCGAVRCRVGWEGLWVPVLRAERMASTNGYLRSTNVGSEFEVVDAPGKGVAADRAAADVLMQRLRASAW